MCSTIARHMLDQSRWEPSTMRRGGSRGMWGRQELVTMIWQAIRISQRYQKLTSKSHWNKRIFLVRVTRDREQSQQCTGLPTQNSRLDSLAVPLVQAFTKWSRRISLEAPTTRRPTLWCRQLDSNERFFSRERVTRQIWISLDKVRQPMIQLQMTRTILAKSLHSRFLGRIEILLWTAARRGRRLSPTATQQNSLASWRRLAARPLLDSINKGLMLPRWIPSTRRFGKRA